MGAWLVGIARHRIADHLADTIAAAKYQMIRGLCLPIWISILLRIPITERIDQLLVLWEELERIGNPQRHIIALAFFEDLTHAQISEPLNIPLGIVQSHIARTLRRLRTLLEGEYAPRT